MKTASIGLPRRRARRSRLRDQVRQLLLDEITSGRRAVGSRIESLDALADAFDVSVFTVREAVANLEARGYIESRHGSGTYVTADHQPLTVDNAVLLCTEARGHLFADLTAALMGRLMAEGFLPGLVDTGSMPAAAEDTRHGLLGRALASEARFFLAHGHSHFRFDALARAALPERHVIGFIDWESALPIPNLHRVISDHVAGGRLVAEHLWNRGHRHALVVGTDNMLRDLEAVNPPHARQGWGFVRAWQEMGGRWSTFHEVASDGGEVEVALNHEAFLETLGGADAPTAIFGQRDLEAWLAQEALLNHAPELARSVEIVGYCNTPWSRAGHPPFTTVDLELNKMGCEIMRLLVALRVDPQAEPADPIWITPRLVVRG